MLKDEIYKHSIDMTSAPVLDLYYVFAAENGMKVTI